MNEAFLWISALPSIFNQLLYHGNKMTSVNSGPKGFLLHRKREDFFPLSTINLEFSFDWIEVEQVFMAKVTIPTPTLQLRGFGIHRMI